MTDRLFRNFSEVNRQKLINAMAVPVETLSGGMRWVELPGLKGWYNHKIVICEIVGEERRRRFILETGIQEDGNENYMVDELIKMIKK